MIYEKGTLKISKKGTHEDEEYTFVERGLYYLPHSCDEWVVGTREDLIRLKEDIEELLENEKDEADIKAAKKAMGEEGGISLEDLIDELGFKEKGGEIKNKNE